MSKIKWLLTIVFCLFMLPSVAHAQDTKINGSQNYSFSLPSNWSSMPGDVVKDVLNDLPSELITNTDSFDAGYYHTGNDFLSFPFILVEHKPSTSPEFKKLVELMKDKSKIAIVTNNTDVAKEANDSHILFNPQNHMLAMRVNKNVPGQGNVAVVSAAFLGIDNYVQFDMYADATSYEKSTTVFNSIIRSNAFTPGFQYADPSSQPKKLTAANNLATFESVVVNHINVNPRIILIIVGGILIIVALLLGKKIRAKI